MKTRRCEIEINVTDGINNGLNPVEEKSSECEDTAIDEIKHRKGEMTPKKEQSIRVGGMGQLWQQSRRSKKRGKVGDSMAKTV